MEPNQGAPVSPTPPDPPPAPGQPTAPVLPATPTVRRRNPLVGFLSVIPPILVIGAIAGFVYYSLYVYKPEEHRACAESVVAQQTDIAVNVVRQWFGKQGPEYEGCQETG